MRTPRHGSKTGHPVTAAGGARGSEVAGSTGRRHRAAAGVAIAGAAGLIVAVLSGGGGSAAPSAAPAVALRGVLADSTSPYPTPVCSGGTCTVTYTPVQGGQTFTVPSTGSIHVTLEGGGGGGSPNASGGAGAQVTATLTEPAGTILGIDAGGFGSSQLPDTVSFGGGFAGGINGGGSGANGGGGGGSSDITLGSTPLLVAGGGGGGGDGTSGVSSATGGFAGCFGDDGSGQGSGGGNAGAAGAQGFSLMSDDAGGYYLNGGGGGQGGSSTSDGGGGSGGSYYYPPYNGTVGTNYDCGEITSMAGQPGAGGSGAQGGSATGQAGGGGGGGYHGGGAGGGGAYTHDTDNGSNIGFVAGYGGGGGGSSYVATRIDVVNGSVGGGQGPGGVEGSVVITYAQPTGTAPGAPVDVAATASVSTVDGVSGVDSATVSFGPPTDDGGQPVEHYTVTVPGHVTAYGGTSPIVVPYLPPGTLYTFDVTATNAAGDTGPAATTMSLLVPGGIVAPGGVTATAGASTTDTGSATVTFDPALAYPAPVTGYIVTATDQTTPANGGRSASGPPSSAGTGPGSGITLLGLVNGDSYTFTVTATNGSATATSAPSNAVTPTGPTTPPGAPTAVTAFVYGYGYSSGIPVLAVDWTPPQAIGSHPISDYTITAIDLSHPGLVVSPIDAGDASGQSTEIYVSQYGFHIGDTYDFTVTASNGATGPASQPSKPLAVTDQGQQPPTPPVDVTPYPGDGSVDLEWSPPTDDEGSAVSGYDVYQSTASGTFERVDATPITSTSTTLDGLTNGQTYSFYVVAENTGGSSEPSGTASATPGSAPAAPSDVSATAGPGQVTVAWSQPTSAGASPVTGYNVYESTSPGQEADSQPVNGYELPPTATSYTATGLTPGRTYDFVVRAYSDVGPSPLSSEASATPTPAASSGPTPPASVPESGLAAELPIAGILLVGGGVLAGRRRRRLRSR